MSNMIAVIIVNFNGGELLGRCLKAVMSMDLVLQVLVVDNGSTDGSLQQIKQQFPHDNHLIIIENGANLGFSRANNIALRRVSHKCDLVLLLNPDCLVSPAALKRMCEFMAVHPEAGMAGCFIANPDGSEQRGCRRLLPTPWSSLKASFPFINKILRTSSGSFNLAGCPLPAEPVEVEAISGAFMMLRRSAIDEVGGLDENYFLHCEDLDWCKRFNLAGWKIYFVPDVKVVHYQGTCSRPRWLRVSWHKHCGMFRFCRKFYWGQYGFGVFTLLAAAIWLRFVVTVPVNLLAAWRDRENCLSGEAPAGDEHCH